MANLSRRHFLSGSGALGFAGSLGAFSTLSAQRAWAADTSGYKAMVCIFLKGGMDQTDTIIPYDLASHTQLRTQHREGLYDAYDADNPTSSRNRANLLKLNPNNANALGGREFAMPPELRVLHAMFESGDLAIVGNVGPMIEQVTRTQMQADTAILPARLYSHNDQQSTWMSLSPEGARYGWGGLFMDRALASAPSANRTFASISTGSNDVFLSGKQAQSYRVADNGAPEANMVGRKWYLGYSNEDEETRARISDYLARSNFDDRNVYTRDLRKANGRAVDNAKVLLAARAAGTTISTQFADDGLSKQMKAVAETINIQQHLNVPRQIFYVTMGAFDTHSNQVNDLPRNHAAISAAMASFKAAMEEIGRWNEVCVFSASDFGRTVIDNGNGTDHGWAGHHFVAGGAVKGKQIYGDLPDLETESEVYTPDRGRLIPSVAIEQYAASIGRWFGLGGSEMRAAMPSLANFDVQNLGFLPGPGSA
jgi:uncharacterized protein (DUF1501 family)